MLPSVILHGTYALICSRHAKLRRRQVANLHRTSLLVRSRVAFFHSIIARFVLATVTFVDLNPAKWCIVILKCHGAHIMRLGEAAARYKVAMAVGLGLRYD